VSGGLALPNINKTILQPLLSYLWSLDRFYDELIPFADKLYDDHLDELKKEGLIK